MIRRRPDGCTCRRSRSRASATLLFAEGVHPKVVQERLGHSQISLTLDTYSHVLPSMQKEAAGKLDALFAKVAKVDAEESPTGAGQSTR